MSAGVAIDPRAKAVESVKKITTVATLPEITSKIIATVEDPRSSAAQLHKIVSHDPALVVRILKVVNSSFYGLPGQINSIERAIVMLGLNAVKNIAVAASLGQLFRGTKLCDGFTMKDLWTHCVAVAVASRELAKKVKPALADEAFLAGMIHDTGMLVSLQLWPEAMKSVCEKAKKSTQSFCEIEEAAVGTNHQAMGGVLAATWKFPAGCQAVAAYHHDVNSAPADQRTLVAIVAAADVICCQTKHGFNLTAAHETIESLGVSDIIPADAVQAVSEKLDTLLADAANLTA